MKPMFNMPQIPDELRRALETMEIVEPTDIQAKVIPEALAGQDIVARSQTGTGKTLAYLLPTLALMKPDEKGLQALVLAPTQELAMQIVEVAKALTADSGLRVDAFIGGANIKRQIERLKKQKPQLVIGTPGRVLELVEQKKLKLHQVRTVVGDEADRMVAEQHSWDAFLQLAKRIGRERQYVFVSATIPPNFAERVADFAPFIVQLEAEGGLLDNELVQHVWIQIEGRDRIDTVRKLLHAEAIKRGIIFVNRLEKVIETTEKLRYRGIKAAALSSDSSKQEREKALQQFRRGEVDVLVATDVASRGLDVDDVTHIIQLDPAATPESYLHRAGRTGRMGKAGMVISLIESHDRYKLDKYRRELDVPMVKGYLAKGELTIGT